MNNNNKLTVIIRDDSPLINCNSCPTYRTVNIPLTREQYGLINLNPNESISLVILEEVDE